MHTLIHLGLDVVFLCVITVLFTIFVVVRPNANRHVSRRKLIGIACVGFVVGIILLHSSSLYATS